MSLGRYRLGRQFATQKFPPHETNVAILPCITLILISDKDVHRSVVQLRVDTLVN